MTHRWVEHTAELELRIRATTEEGVFAEALTAFSELVRNGEEGETVRHEVTAQAPDRAALLAQWLEELVFLAETDAFVPERLVSIDFEGDRLRAQVEGRRGTPPHLVKAVTYHGLELAPEDGEWRARAVLDV